MRILTVGYEGVLLKTLIKRLEDKQVTIVLDIRRVAKSPRFTKTELKEALEEAGIQYAHIREISKWDGESFGQPTGLLEELCRRWKNEVVCLFSYEQRPAVRRMKIAEKFAEIAGTTVEHLKIPGDTYIFEWREIARRKKKEVGKCEICGGLAEEVHHKDGDKANCEESNLMVLCRSCHRKLHSSRKKEAKRPGKGKIRQKSLF